MSKRIQGFDATNTSLDRDQDGCHDEEEDDDDDGDGFADIFDLCPRGLVGLLCLLKILIRMDVSMAGKMWMMMQTVFSTMRIFVRERR